MRKTMSDILQKLQKILDDSIDSTPQRVSHFFKMGSGDYAEHDRFRGITVPTLRKIAKKFFTVTLQDVQILLQSHYNEERFLALVILVHHYQQGDDSYKKKMYQFYMQNLTYVNNWNLVDSSAHLIVGAHLFERDCSLLVQLAQSHNIWERRIAIVATWYFIRNSELEWTFKIAKLLLNDSHDLIHKAAGWMLREAGKKDEVQLVTFLDQHMYAMPRTMLRYAIERLSNDQKQAIKDSCQKEH